MKAQTINRSERKKEKISKAEKVYNAMQKIKQRAAGQKKEAGHA